MKILISEIRVKNLFDNPVIQHYDEKVMESVINKIEFKSVWVF